MEIFTWLNLLSNYHILILHRRKGNEFMSQDTSTIKQLKARQNALLHGILLMSVLLLADTYLRTRSYILIDGIWDNTFIIVAAFTLIFLEMIIKGACDLSDPVSVSYTHLDVYKRQAVTRRTGFPGSRTAERQRLFPGFRLIT